MICESNDHLDAHCRWRKKKKIKKSNQRQGIRALLKNLMYGYQLNSMQISNFVMFAVVPSATEIVFAYPVGEGTNKFN